MTGRVVRRVIRRPGGSKLVHGRIGWLIGWRAGWLLGRLQRSARRLGRSRRSGWRRIWPWRRLAVVLAAAALLQFVVVRQSVAPGQPLPVAGLSTAELRIHTAAQVPVGKPVAVEVAGARPRAQVALTVSGVLGTITLTAAAESSGVARFSLPHPATSWAGLIVLQVGSGDALGEQTMALTPGAVIGPVTGLTGPGRIVADAHEHSMDVVIPMDRYGNAPVDGVRVGFTRIWPDGRRTHSSARSDHLLAWTQLDSGLLAGTDYLHADVDTATGPDAALGEVAAAPTGWTLQTPRRTLTADGRLLTEVDTSPLRDQHGNLEADGTAVTLAGQGPGGAWQMSQTTVAGVARFFVQASTAPGTVTLVGYCRGSLAAKPLSLIFRVDADRLPVTAVRHGQYLEVSIGPVSDVSGAQLDDGAAVQVSARDRNGNRASGTGELVDGQLSLELAAGRLRAPIRVTASLLGRRGETSVP
jgi:hypothetical protein